MPDYPREFVVDDWTKGEADRFRVLGRCGNSPIRVDDRFDTLVRFKPRAYPHGLADPPVVDKLQPVSVSVECIHAYGHSLQELGQGMTGELVLRGSAGSHVPPGWVLGLRRDFTASSAESAPSP